MAATEEEHQGVVTGEPTKRKLTQRGRDTVASAKVKAEELRARAEARRPRYPAVDVAFRSIERDAEVGGGIMAGALAFRVFLFLVPLVFFFVYAFGLAATASGKTTRELADSAGVAGLVAASINATTEQSVWNRITFMLVSGFAMVVASRTFMKSLNAVHVLVWGLPRTRLRKTVKAVGGLIFSVALGLVMLQGISRLRESFLAGWVFGELVFMAFPFAVWLLGSMKVFPRPAETTWKDLVPGAIVLAVGIEVLQVVTVLWISRSFERRSETYGAIGGSLALLLWAYLVGRIMCGAVVLNAVIWRRAHPDEPSP